MAYSFYGGKEGVSFLIKARFDSVNDMTLAFSQGGAYNEVGYGEFVIIDTPNKNDYENGTVYRRGFDYSSDMGTARPTRQDTERIIITQGALSLEVDNRIYWDDTHTLSESSGVIIDTVTPGNFKSEEYNAAVIAYLKAPGAGAIYVGRIVGPEGPATPMELATWSKFMEMFPQAEDGERDDNIILERSSGKIVDVAKGGYCTIRDNDGNIKRGYFSLDLPQDIFEVQAESASPYGPTIIDTNVLPAFGEQDTYYKVNGVYNLYENGTWIERAPWIATSTLSISGQTEWNYSNLIREKQESEGHPYYHSYDIKIPKGIHGQGIDEAGINITGERDANGDIISNTNNHNYQWYFESRNYDKKADGEVERHYLGSFHKVIDRITTNPQAANNVFPLVARNTAYTTGDFVRVSDNDNIALLCSVSGTTAAAAPIPSFANVAISYHFMDGTVKWTVVDKNDIPANTMTIHYTHDGNADFALRLLESLEFDDDGRIYAKYTDLNHRSYVGDNKCIIGVGYNNDPRVCCFYIMYNTYKRKSNGQLDIHDTFTYNTQGTGVLVYPTTDSNGREIEYIQEKIEFVTNMSIENDDGSTGIDLNKTRRWVITYNTGKKNKLSIINEVVTMKLIGDNLMILYSDPAYRAALPNKYQAEYNNVMYDWANLGPILQGNHVIGNFATIADLKAAYPYGFGKDTSGNVDVTTQNRMGWTATVGDAVNGYTVWAYDYNNPTPGPDAWYAIQQLDTSTIDPRLSLLAAKPDSNNPTLPENNNLLNEYGLWFVVSN